MKILFSSILILSLSACVSTQQPSKGVIMSNDLIVIDTSIVTSAYIDNINSTEVLENEDEIFDEMYVVQDTFGNPVHGFAYKITTEEGEVYRGVTNEKGQTVRVYTGNKAVNMVLTQDNGED